MIPLRITCTDQAACVEAMNAIQPIVTTIVVGVVVAVAALQIYMLLRKSGAKPVE